MRMEERDRKVPPGASPEHLEHLFGVENNDGLLFRQNDSEGVLDDQEQFFF